MAFQNKNLSVIAYANGFTLWHYLAKGEKLSSVLKDGYFNDIKTLMNVGDIIILNADDNTCLCKIDSAASFISISAIGQ